MRAEVVMEGGRSALSLSLVAAPQLHRERPLGDSLVSVGKVLRQREKQKVKDLELDGNMVSSPLRLR